MVQASAESKEGIRRARVTPRECKELYTELRGDGGIRVQLFMREWVVAKLHRAEAGAGEVDLVAVHVSTN